MAEEEWNAEVPHPKLATQQSNYFLFQVPLMIGEAISVRECVKWPTWSVKLF